MLLNPGVKQESDEEDSKAQEPGVAEAGQEDPAGQSGSAEVDSGVLHAAVAKAVMPKPAVLLSAEPHEKSMIERVQAEVTEGTLPAAIPPTRSSVIAESTEVAGDGSTGWSIPLAAAPSMDLSVLTDEERTFVLKKTSMLVSVSQDQRNLNLSTKTKEFTSEEVEAARRDGFGCDDIGVELATGTMGLDTSGNAIEMTRAAQKPIAADPRTGAG